MLAPLPSSYEGTRGALQRVAVHVLARRRHALSGKFGLRATPGGIATPAAGPEHEVVRTSGTWLLRERTGASASAVAVDLRTATLADAARLVEVDLAAEFSVGTDTPPVGAVDEPLAVEAAAAIVLADWYALGWRVLDAVTVDLAAPAVTQIWPEHFDAGCDVAAGEGRANLGASPGDGYHAAPYLYLGPWGEDRPGDEQYWNAPFGAVLPYDELRPAEDPIAAGVAFLRRGLALLQG